MNLDFIAAVESLDPNFQKLVNAEPHSFGKKLPKRGVYLFREKGKALYVGRSNNIPRRRNAHRRLSSGPHQAALAALIAKAETNRPIDYRKGARQRLLTDELFMDSFRRAIIRVREMEFHAVEEPDQTRQALLEVYCAIALKTRYNDFGTH